ncbi:D-amino-acid transaminase [Heyndrickxia acidiproducens]|uniref:D-amino-acid transaminase n=1 Tax=Heyndrickxia acidiproducens TaxID=1121084 RepID=UPI0003747427|nr:D-amino-acid transaminase [Heyndrickxia acidiproducens]
MEKLILNGKLIGREQASIDIEDRGYQFGDGIYEVIRVYGGRLFANEAHLRRLYSSAEKLSLDIPYTAQELTEQIEALVRGNGLDTGIVYLQFTRGAAHRKHSFPEKSETVFVAYTNELERPLHQLEHGIQAVLTEDIRWLRCDIKSLNLLGNVLAKQKAAENGCGEAVQHRGEIVTEGSSSNVFIVKNGELITHPLSNLILNGITRQVILDICEKQQLPVREETFTIRQLFDADEAFISSTTSEVMPVVQINDQKIGSGKPGAVTRKLQGYFKERMDQLTKAITTGPAE